MTVTTKEKQEFTFTGKHMLATMICFFGVIITVNFTMAYLALGSWTGLVVKNSYVASQKFNDELLEAKAQQQAGFRSKLAYENGVLTFELMDKSGKALKLQNAVVEIGRPAFEQADITLGFSVVSEESSTLHTDLAPGVWAVKITGKSNTSNYRRDARIFVNDDGVGRIE